jgi:D-amino-acid dehydrogenase
MSRVVVIGGGVIGLCSAWALQRRGWQVTVITDKSPGYGASSVNAGWVIPAHSEPIPSPGLAKQSLKWMRRSDSPLYIQPRPSPGMTRWLVDFWRHCNERDYRAGVDAIAELNRKTLPLYDELRASGVEFEEHRDGILYVYQNPAPLDHAFKEFDYMRSYGIGLSGPFFGDDLRELEPALNDEITAGFWLDQDRSLRPDTLIAGLSTWLSDNEVDIRSGTSVTGFDIRHDRVTDVRLDKGRLETDAVLIAAGAWSPSLARFAKRRVPIQAGKGYCLDYTPSPVPVRHPMHVHDARHAITPMDGVTRLAGTMEFSGINERIRPERVNAIVKGAAATIRDWPTDPSIPTVKTGLRPISSDGLPLIGLVKGYRNLAIAAGHGMLGLTLAPATADAIADLLTTGTAPGVLFPFDPARF